MSNWPSWLPLRKDLQDLSPYGAPQINDVTALNTNENPFPLPKSVVDAMLARLPEVLRDLNRYPDRDAVELRSALAAYINNLSKTSFTSENIWAANGSNEILQTLVLACGQGGVLGFTPSYSMHPLITKVCGAKWINGLRNEDFTLDSKKASEQIKKEKPTIVFITTPNNPTGGAVSIEAITELATAAKSIGALIVVDEAYAEFSKENSAVSLISAFENLVVVRTMSKAFALAGARVGYLVGNPKVVDVALITRLPYHLSAQTQAVATVALENHDLLQKEVDLLISERIRVVTELNKMGFEVIPSSANFLLFTGFEGSSKEVWNSLLDKKVLIRDVGIPNYLRTTIGTPEENNQFLAAISAHRP
jgi:histidinol-phosphate aminotransferase